MDFNYLNILLGLASEGPVNESEAYLRLHRLRPIGFNGPLSVFDCRGSQPLLRGFLNE